MKTKTIPSPILGIVSALGLSVLAVGDTPIVFDLDFDSLPSAQGWSLYANYPETQVVGLADGILSFDSRTSSSSVVAGGYRIILDGVDLQPAHAIEFRAAVVDPNPGSSKGHGEFFLDVLGAGGTRMLFSVKDNFARISTPSPQAPSSESSYKFDAAAFHDYRIEVVNGVGIKVFVDGFLAAANSSSSISSGGPLYVNFGIQRTRWFSESLRIELNKLRLEKLSAVDVRPVVTVQAPESALEGEAPTVPLTLADLNGEALYWTALLDGVTFDSEVIPASTRPLKLHRRELTLPGLAVGTHTLRVEVADDSSQRGVAEKTIEVLDITPPEILSATPTPAILWPPNKRMVPISFEVVVSDNSGVALWGIESVTCNDQYDPSDISLTVENDEQSLALRATRNKGHSHSGRIYTIVLRAWDEAGNLSEPLEVTVTVPHDRRGGAKR